MKKINEIEFMNDLIEACYGFWSAGWGEFHAGNISYLLSDKEMDELKDILNILSHVEVEFDTSGLEGKCFVVSRSGASFRTMPKRFENDLGIIKFTKGSYDILWGLQEGKGRPTSELAAHVLCHRNRLAQDKNNKIVMHCHPTYVNAMTMIHTLEEAEFTKTLWRMNSECVLVFPEGVSVLPWMVCGKGQIGPETAAKMNKTRVVIWPFHGMFASSNSLDEAIGLIETIEKNAQVYVVTKGNVIHSMTDNNVEELAHHFDIR